jgi:hypothetical protein
MNIKISVEMTLRRRVRNTREQLRWFGWLVRLAGVGLLIWATTPPYDLGLLVLGIVYLLGPEVLGVLRQALGKRFGRVYTYTLDDDGIAIRTALSNLEFTWAAVKSIRQTATAWNVRLPGAGGFTLPRDGFTAEQADEFQAFLAGRGLVRT